MTKKGHQKFWLMKIKKLVKKVKLGKFSTESEKFHGNRGKSETGGNASLPQRDGRLTKNKRQFIILTISKISGRERVEAKPSRPMQIRIEKQVGPNCNLQ